VVALIIPGVAFIYYLYFTDAKYYFENKRCQACGITKYKNMGYLFKGIQCRACRKEIKLANA
jgi:hypothetical protein